MLLTLSIKNIALIDSLEINFSSGLTILSGETGAGKSIIIDSINFVLGARADKSLIRYGSEEAFVEAEFDTDINPLARAVLDEYEIECSEGVIVSRKMTLEGKNTCRINGIKVTAAILREVAVRLMDIYGQHDTTALMQPKMHLGIIDNYGKESIKLALESYKEKYSEYNEVKTKLKAYGSIDDVNGRIAKLGEQIEIIGNAKLKIGEEETLAEKLKFLEASEEIRDGVEGANEYLDGEEGSLSSIKRAIDCLKPIASFNKAIVEGIERLETCSIEIEDIVNTLSRMSSNIETNEYEKDKVEERLDEIRAVVARYGSTEELALKTLGKYKSDYEYYSNSEFEIIELNKKKNKIVDELYSKAVALSQDRQKVAEVFEFGVLEELKELGMGKTKFKVGFGEIPSKQEFLQDLTAYGVDKIEFLLSPNPGQPLKTLSKIISGGEMSRFMLAIKKLTCDIDGVSAMVFDEIDTGISGNIAMVVARKLSDISSDKQVLAITHLPQLASYADTHYYIEKTQTDVSTSTNLVELKGDKVAEELSRLIGGGSANNTHSLAHAHEMLAEARQYVDNRKSKIIL